MHRYFSIFGAHYHDLIHISHYLGLIALPFISEAFISVRHIYDHSILKSIFIIHNQDYRFRIALISRLLRLSPRHSQETPLRQAVSISL